MKSLIFIKSKRNFISSEKWNEISMLLFLFIIPFIIAVFRPLWSIDTSTYLYYYKNASFDYNEVEKSFSLISIFAKKILGEGNGFRFVIFVYEFLASITLFKILQKSEFPFICFIVYFSFAYMYQMCIQMRSAFSNLLFILALYDIRDKKTANYYLKMIVAFIFHQSAILFFLIYPVAGFIIKHKKTLYLLPIFAVFFSFMFAKGIAFVSNFENSSFRPLKLIYTYAYLAQKSGETANPINKISLFVFAIYYFFIFFVHVKKMSKTEIISLTVLSISIFCYFFGALTLPVIAQRYSVALNLVLLILIPCLFARVKEKWLLLIFIGMYLCIVSCEYSTLQILLSYF